MPHPTVAYVADLIVGAALLLASYPLHAAACWWVGLAVVVLTNGTPTVASVWRIVRPEPVVVVQRAE